MSKVYVSTLRSRQKDLTTATILDAAEEVLAKGGLGAASMGAIARRAGVAVGTLYNHFGDRDELIRALLHSRRTAFLRWLDHEVAGLAGKKFEPALRALVRALLARFDARRPFIRLALDSDLSHAKGGNGRPLALMVDRFEGLMARGLSEGALRRDGADLHAIVLAGIIRALLVRLLEQPERPLAEAADQVVDLFLRGATKR